MYLWRAVDYLHSLRVAMAKNLLERGRLTIQEIGEEVGYTDLIFFRKLFKRYTGLSPNDYRKRFGDTRQVIAVG